MFVVFREKWGKDKVVLIKLVEKDEKVFERIKERVKKESGSEIKEWDWGGRKGEIEGFRYWMEDVLKVVIGKRVVEVRREEVRWELLNSEKFKFYFVVNFFDLFYFWYDIFFYFIW